MGLGENNPCRVFLSHTSEFRNFPRGRSYLEAVESAVSAAGHVIVDMREFAASDAAPAQVCQEKVRGCELYLGIFGTRYGSPVRDRRELSYTELEFETASDPAHPLERLVFLLDQEAENPGIPAKWLNDPIHGARQEAFLRKVKDAGLTLQTFGNPDELARLVERSLEEWQKRERARQAALAQSQQKTVPQITRLPFMAPDLPIGFVQRPKQFEALRALLLEGERKDPVAITTALTGAGGFGKTTLAAALCHDEEIIQAFDDGILWTTLGETPDLADALAKLHAGLTGERPSFKDAEDAATSLAERLEGKNCLVVIDDVWDPAHLEPFLRGGPGCARLITSRLLQVATDVQAKRLLVDEMSASEAVAMLTARLPGPPPDPAPFQALAQALGEWPLLLRLAACAMAELVELGSSVAEALATILVDLAEGGITSWDRDSPSDRNAAVAQTLQLSLKRLTAAEQEHYKMLAVFPEDEPIPLQVASELWGLGGSNSRRLAFKLAKASLLEFNPAAGLIRLHDVLRTFLGQTLGQAGLAQAHAGLIDSWGDPHQLPHPYAWRWIGYHLEAAGRQSQLDGLLLDLSWLQGKLNATGIAALEREFDHGSDSAALQRLRRLLRNASHVLAAQPEQLPSQLLARWPTDPPGGPTGAAATSLRDQAITQLQQAGGLRPLTASLLADEALLRTLSGDGSSVNALVVLPGGRLASGGGDRTIKLWDPASGQLQATLEGHYGSVNALAVLPGGRLASGADLTIKLWDPASGQLQATLEGHSGWVRALAVLPDGRLASGSGDKTIRLWDPASGTCERLFEGHQGGVSALAVLGDGRLASGSRDSTIQLWDPAGGESLSGPNSQLHELNEASLGLDGELKSTAESLTLTLVEIPAGSFLMGSTPEEPERADDEGPLHEVKLESFFISQTPITQAQWREVAGWQPLPAERWRQDLNPDPSRFQNREGQAEGEVRLFEGEANTDNRPVEQVSWLDAIEFCNRLSQRTGRTYTVPSESQWEYACRAGSITPFYFGATITPELANYIGNVTYADGLKGINREQTTPVGMLPANAWGLHDMHGNVDEWCLDHWHHGYEGAPTDGSAWLSSTDQQQQSTLNAVGDGTDDSEPRLLRGGSWDDDPRDCRSASRLHDLPGNAYYDVGFRVVCLPQGPSLNP